jgi:hypothetical protein
MPQATYVAFNPAGNTGAAGQWQHSVVGQWSDPNDVADGAAHGAFFFSFRARACVCP